MNILLENKKLKQTQKKCSRSRDFKNNQREYREREKKIIAPANTMIQSSE